MTHNITLTGYTAAVDGAVCGRLELGTWGSYGIEQLQITPGEGWEGLTLTATFRAGKAEPIRVFVPEGGLLEVPPEATATDGAALGQIVFSGIADGVQRISCDVPYTVRGHAPVNGSDTAGTTPDALTLALANRGAVSYWPQTLTEDQQAQARKNIGANAALAPLTFSGAASGQYTGDKPLTIQIPEGTNDLRILNGKLYLTRDGVLVGTGVTLPTGGSGSGSSSAITLTNLLESNSLTCAVGSPAMLRFNYASSEDAGNGTAYIYVGTVLKGTATIQPGENALDVQAYIGEGTNSVKVTCMDIYSNQKSLAYTVTAVALRITSSFDDTTVYSDQISYRYTPHGAIEKTIHFVIDGTEVAAHTTSETGKQATQILPAQSHGVHRLEVYATATVGETDLTSNVLLYDLLCTADGSTAPMIASVYTTTAVTQGELISIPFIVYDPLTLTCDVTLTIEAGGEVYSTTTLNVDRTRQTWAVRDYPVGEVTFTIAYYGLSKSHTVTVAENNVPVYVTAEDKLLELSSAGRNNSETNRDQWISGEVTTTFSGMNWAGTGWVADSTGDVALRLAGDARATINYTPFSTDARQTGYTLELEFAIRDVNNREAVAISCLDSNIGFTVTADTARFRSELTEVSCNYTDEERIRVTFVVEPRSDNRLVMVYLNGKLSSSKQYPDNDNFQQKTPAAISIGSDDCSIDLYRIRVYNAALTHAQVRDNYIAEISDVADKAAEYADNDIYDIYGNLSYEKVRSKIPTVVITGQLPTVKGDKKSVTIAFENPFDASVNYEDSATLDVQGTSSQWYVRKNYKGKHTNYHAHEAGQIESRVFTWKADYAEATSTHNTGNANYVHTLYDELTPPQELDSRVRTTIYGFPCVVFHREDSSSEPVFLGKYNFNYDKGSEEAFGFSSAYPQAQCWEFCNNTSDACLFHGPVPASWSGDFEARYPDGCKDISAFTIMHNWVVSTWQDAATGAALAEAYTGEDGTEHTADTTEYRLAKFRKEFTEHFDLHYSLVYYVYTLVMLMADQRAKNMFLTTWYGVRWAPWLYDNDTCLGINNEGALVFDYYHEDIDQVNKANVYNGQTSTLWVNFRQAFAAEIQELYKALRSDGRLSYTKIIEYFLTKQADKWSTSIYNEDSEFKYISMLRSDNDATNLGQVRGDGAAHLRYFVKNRLMYLDSKFYAKEYADDYVSLRIYTPSEWAGVEPNADITVTPYSHMYAGVRYKANGTLQQHRAEKNAPVTFAAPDETFNDTETAVYGASQISSLGDLSPLYCGSINVSKATKLVELIAGSAAEGYSNGNLTELSVGTNRLLRKVDVRNCPNLTAPLDLSGCPNIEEIYATGTGITGVKLPESGYLKVLMLPCTVSNLTVLNQQFIQSMSAETYANLTTLWIDNAANIPMEDILEAAVSLNRVRILNVDLSLGTYAVLDRLASCAGLSETGANTESAVVTGKAHVPQIGEKKLAYLNEKLPLLTISYDMLLPEYTVTFVDWDGTVLNVQQVTAGDSALEPITAGLIETPTRESTDQYDYTFDHWDGSYSSIAGDCNVIAAYAGIIRKYTVRFYNGIVLLQTITGVAYGSTANYSGETPTKSGFYKFTGWSPEPSSIQGDTDCYAQYEYTGVARKFVQRTISGTYANPRVQNVGKYAFANTKLETLDFALVLSISDNAFNGCSSLATLILRTETVCALSATSAFTSTSIASGTGYIYVPAALLEEYKAATNWSTYADQFRAIEDYPDICGGDA